MSWSPREYKSFLLGIGLMAVVMCVLYARPTSYGGAQDAQVEVEEYRSEEGAVPAHHHQQPPQHHHVAHPPPPPAPQAHSSELRLEGKILKKHCLHGDTSDAYYQCRRKALLHGCSEICDTTLEGEPSKYFNFASKHVDCEGIWFNEEIDASLIDSQWPPPAYPPDIFLKDFQQNGRVDVMRFKHFQQRYSGGDARTTEWTEATLNQMIAQARTGTLGGSYGTLETNEVRNALRQMNIPGKRVLVIGSEQPWAEVCALEAGAAEVWTLEYGRIHSTHPQVFTMTPDEARQKYIDGTLPLFDVVLTFSSVEHSGLGRYGDALNPWGDMQAIARAWCITKPGGQMLLGVQQCGPNQSQKPLVTYPRPAIEYNLHRCYHSTSFTHLTANWEQVWRGDPGQEQPVHIFRRAEAPKAPRKQYPN